MNIDDLKYLVNDLSSLSGVPVRIYKQEELIYFSSLIPLYKDPFILFKYKLKSIKGNLNYFQTDDFFFYAFVRSEDLTIVEGPFRMIKPDTSSLQRMAFELEIPKDEIEEFISSMEKINTLPLETVIKSLCMFNFILNGEKKYFSNIIINENKNNEIKNKIHTITSAEKIDSSYDFTNNSLSIENEIINIVEHGDINKLKGWIKQAPAARPGILSNDSLRQIKNTFIAATTLFSRAAIRGGMNCSDALSLSDLYIQKMELTTKLEDIYSLQMNMLFDYTETIAKIKGKKNSSFLINLNKYIFSHLSDAIKVDDVCKALYISKSALFNRLKKETNMTFSEYVLSLKINEAKSLLKTTNKTITSISIYLGFSSQSHFNHAFKEFVKKTPLEYRKEKRNK